MKTLGLLGRTAGLSLVLALSATPAFSQDREDRARVAIGEARAKIDAANKIGAAGEVPRMVAEASAALRDAEEQFKRDHNSNAIAAAHRASELADVALGEAQKSQTNAARAETGAAQMAAEDARREAAAANERAASAESAAAAASADAAAARATPPQPVIVAAPAAPATTVTVEKTEQTTRPAASYSAKPKKVVKKKTTVRPAARTTETETTTVTTTPNP